jgi:hypothetical protein
MRKNKSRTDGLEFQFFRFREQTVFAREPGKVESLLILEFLKPISWQSSPRVVAGA